MSSATTPSTINGVNVEQLETGINAIQGEPDLAKFQFRATNTWIHGGHNRTTIKEFYGVGKEDTIRNKPFVLDADEPPVLFGEDQGANPVEFVPSCLGVLPDHVNGLSCCGTGHQNRLYRIPIGRRLRSPRISWAVPRCSSRLRKSPGSIHGEKRRPGRDAPGIDETYTRFRHRN